MATNEDKHRSSKSLHNKPPKKKLRTAGNMKDDGRDSLVEFQSSIFDASDGHQLVDFIRKKKGLLTQPQKIFDDVRTDRDSLQIEIQMLNEDENTLRAKEPEEPAPSNVVNNETRSPGTENAKADSVNSPRIPPIKSPSFYETRAKLKRLSHSIGRRTLLKEFERTLQESRFLPETCSTPLTVNLSNLPVNTANKKALSKGTSIAQEKNSLNLVCTPITVTDEDSPAQSTPKEQSEKNKTQSATGNTDDMMRDLQHQNDMLLELANSDEETVGRLQMSPEPPHNDKENPQFSQPSFTSTPTKKPQRRTYTIYRNNTMGNFIVLPDKSSEEQELPKTPLKNAEINTRKLVVTPEQKKLLLSKFGRHLTDPSQRIASSQKTSRIPVIMKGNTTPAPPKEGQNAEAANSTTSYQGPEHRETSQIIEQLQKSGLSSNAPVIVIPVNQTFNQAPSVTSKSATASTYMNSPNSNEISSTTATVVPQPEVVVTRTTNRASTAVNSLRLGDIITEDDSSSSDDNQIISRHVTKQQAARKSSDSMAKQRLSTRSENTFNLRQPPPRSSSRHVRELISSHQLSKMSVNEILDLRKRNSHGELRKSLQISKHESSMLNKQMELELLRRNIQEKNYEDEILQMEVLPPPPEDFSDKPNSMNQHHSVLPISSVVADDLVDEMSSDRVSLSQEPPERLKLVKGIRRSRKKKKMTEQLEKYLEASQVVSKSKYLNLSKRKLYSKGNSEPPSSSESSPAKSPSYCISNTSRISKTSVRIPAAPTSPIPYLSPPADFANKSLGKTQFLPTDDEIFKKPIGRPPKKAITKQKKQKSDSVHKTRSTTRKTPVSHSSSPSPDPPVDPVETSNTNSNINESSALRRSKRGRKPLTAFWSCSQKEYVPLYDICRIQAPKRNGSMAKQKPSTAKKAKNLSSSEDNLVANTKKTRSNSVKQTKTKKKSNESKQSKRKEDKLSECPSNSTSIHAQKPVEDLDNPEDHPLVMDRLSDFQGSEKQTKTNKTNSTEILASNSTTSPSECQSENMTGQLSTNTEGTIMGENSKSKSKKNQPTTDASTSEEENRRLTRSQKNSISYMEKPTTSKPKRVKSKKKQTSIDSHATSSDCPSDDYPSSIQQKRLTTIAEDSIPGLSEQVTISVSDLDKSNKNQLSSTLMPPPASNIVYNKAQKSKRTEKDAFRKGHDESIADASSVHVNKLFDQLKSSSMCVAADDTTQHVTGNGQVSLGPLASERNAGESRCKNLTVRLSRMKARKPLAENIDKVCDSGFSSEDMSSDPKQRGDILLNWLKQILRNGKSPSDSQKGVARFLQSDGFHTARVDDLVFQEIDGVDYAFYNSKQQFSIGYIRFNPNTEKKKCTAKKYELNFVVLCGSVVITANTNSFDCKNGDLITVFIGTSYRIKNISNDPALVMVIKK